MLSPFCISWITARKEFFRECVEKRTILLASPHPAVHWDVRASVAEIKILRICSCPEFSACRDGAMRENLLHQASPSGFSISSSLYALSRTCAPVTGLPVIRSPFPNITDRLPRRIDVPTVGLKHWAGKTIGGNLREIKSIDDRNS